LLIVPANGAPSAARRHPQAEASRMPMTGSGKRGAAIASHTRSPVEGCVGKSNSLCYQQPDHAKAEEHVKITVLFISLYVRMIEAASNGASFSQLVNQ
jgi:hypothetical protein